MFTVRHERNGMDAFYEAEGVEYWGPHANAAPEGLHLLGETDGPSDGTKRVLKGGRAFVMNDAGQTVATYRLIEGGAEEPVQGAKAAIGGGVALGIPS